jgi:hypothetical protein
MKKPYVKPDVESEQAFETLSGCATEDITDPVCQPSPGPVGP